MTHCWWARMGIQAAFLLVLFTGVPKIPAQQVNGAAILQKIDAAVKARVDGIEAYTDTEHYAVFRSGDETHPVAEMTVKTTYKRETGKSYQILSESGSTLMRSLVLHAILENEQHVNQPGIREGLWITTANYAMQVKPGGVQQVDGRDCIAATLTPRRKEPYLVEGTLWVDAQNGEIVKFEGKASRSSSLLDGADGDDAAIMWTLTGLGRRHMRGRSRTVSVWTDRGEDRLHRLPDSAAHGTLRRPMSIAHAKCIVSPLY